VWCVRLAAVFPALAYGPPALGAGGDLAESVEAEQIPRVWPHLSNEGVMFPMVIRDVAVKIGPEHQLFVDNDLIAEATNLTREVHHPERYKENPILRPAQPDEARSAAFVFSVIRCDEPPAFRMWYLSWRAWHDWKDGQEIRFATSYAVSDDGLHWKRPELNLHHIEGSTEKNIVIPYGLAQGMFYEPWEPDPQKRFKALVCVEARRKGETKLTVPEGYYLHTSPDGVHWKADLSHYVIPSLRGYTIPQSGAGDTSRFWWDAIRREYVGDVKFVLPGKLRCRGVMASDDLVHWTRPRPTLFARRGEDQIYGHTGFAYQGMYIGTRWIFRCQYDRNTHSMDVELDCSRDGKLWTRVGAGQPFMALNTKRDTWDCSRIKPTTLMVVGDEIWIYYTAAPTAMDLAAGKLPASHRVGYSVGLARLKLDRFASINADDKPGRLVTRPIGFVGKTLHINAEAAPDGEIRVGLLSRDGRAMDAFGCHDCVPIRGNSTDTPVKWRSSSDISALSNTGVRIQFALHKAKLYSFWID
jgi:hypothetical protein